LSSQKIGLFSYVQHKQRIAIWYTQEVRYTVGRRRASETRQSNVQMKRMFVDTIRVSNLYKLFLE